MRGVIYPKICWTADVNFSCRALPTLRASQRIRCITNRESDILIVYHFNMIASSSLWKYGIRRFFWQKIFRPWIFRNRFYNTKFSETNFPTPNFLTTTFSDNYIFRRKIFPTDKFSEKLIYILTCKDNLLKYTIAKVKIYHYKH